MVRRETVVVPGADEQVDFPVHTIVPRFRTPALTPTIANFSGKLVCYNDSLHIGTNAISRQRLRWCSVRAYQVTKPSPKESDRTSTIAGEPHDHLSTRVCSHHFVTEECLIGRRAKRRQETMHIGWMYYKGVQKPK